MATSTITSIPPLGNTSVIFWIQ